MGENLQTCQVPQTMFLSGSTHLCSFTPITQQLLEFFSPVKRLGQVNGHMLTLAASPARRCNGARCAPCVHPAMLSQEQCCSPRQRTDTSHAGDFICPICLEVISDAVWLVNTRQLYDRRCLVHWFEAGALTLHPPHTLSAVVSPFAPNPCHMYHMVLQMSLLKVV